MGEFESFTCVDHELDRVNSTGVHPTASASDNVRAVL